VHKQRALNTRLSSGTSAGTFAVSVGPYRNYQAEAGTKNEPDTFLVPVQKKGWKSDPHVSNLRSREFLFQGVQVTLKLKSASSILQALSCRFFGCNLLVLVFPAFMDLLRFV